MQTSSIRWFKFLMYELNATADHRFETKYYVVWFLHIVISFGKLLISIAYNCVWTVFVLKMYIETKSCLFLFETMLRILKCTITMGDVFVGGLFAYIGLLIGTVRTSSVAKCACDDEMAACGCINFQERWNLCQFSHQVSHRIVRVVSFGWRKAKWRLVEVLNVSLIICQTRT